jgi:hypothetical protein
MKRKLFPRQASRGGGDPDPSVVVETVKRMKLNECLEISEELLIGIDGVGGVCVTVGVGGVRVIVGGGRLKINRFLFNADFYLI